MALIAISSFGYSQVVEKQDPIKKTITQPEKLVFSSQKEKSEQIERTQKLIDYRLSKGKSKEEMSAYYVELKRIQDALITPKK